jgi:hypothetical protein
MSVENCGFAAEDNRQLAAARASASTRGLDIAFSRSISPKWQSFA